MQRARGLTDPASQGYGAEQGVTRAGEIDVCELGEGTVDDGHLGLLGQLHGAQASPERPRRLHLTSAAMGLEQVLTQGTPEVVGASVIADEAGLEGNVLSEVVPELGEILHELLEGLWRQIRRHRDGLSAVS